jgi:hypothetical protein
MTWLSLNANESRLEHALHLLHEASVWRIAVVIHTTAAGTPVYPEFASSLFFRAEDHLATGSSTAVERYHAENAPASIGDADRSARPRQKCLPALITRLVARNVLLLSFVNTRPVYAVKRKSPTAGYFD